MRVAYAVLTALALSSCSANVERETPEIKIVKLAVSQRVSNTIVGVKLTNPTHLSVNLVNSPLKKLPDAARAAKAAEIAKIAFDSYDCGRQLKSVRVSFVELATFIVLVTTNDSSDSFTFDVQELVSR